MSLSVFRRKKEVSRQLRLTPGEDPWEPRVFKPVEELKERLSLVLRILTERLILGRPENRDDGLDGSEQ
jgi:hypothetical protein